MRQHEWMQVMTQDWMLQWEVDCGLTVVLGGRCCWGATKGVREEAGSIACTFHWGGVRSPVITQHTSHERLHLPAATAACRHMPCII